MDEFARRLASYDRLLYAYVFSFVHDAHAAEEIIQETYVSLLQKIDEWEPAKDFYSWVRAFAHNKVLTYRSRRQRDRRLGERFFERVAAAQAAKADESNSRLDALEQCIEQLSQSNRRLLEMAYGEGLAIAKVAEEAGRSLVATYQLLARLRLLLRQCIERNVRAEGHK